MLIWFRWISLVFLCLAGQAAHAVTQTFAFTGATQTFVVPAGVTTIAVEAWGAQGGFNTAVTNNLGGYAAGDLTVVPGDVLTIRVGGQGVGLAGGFNGGGAGDTGGAGGGGASDIRRGGDALTDRVLVAGGGGGGGFWAANGQEITGGFGGGLNGGLGFRGAPATVGGTGGGQAPGGNGTCINFNVVALAGSFGQGGTPAGFNCGCEGYGGGGGWYGGAGSGNCRGGGGGSSYLGGVAAASTQNGIQAGNGLVRLVFFPAAVAGSPEPVPFLGFWGLLATGVLVAGFAARRFKR